MLTQADADNEAAILTEMMCKIDIMKDDLFSISDREIFTFNHAFYLPFEKVKAK